jgi:hypothetical protein
MQFNPIFTVDGRGLVLELYLVRQVSVGNR